MNIDRQTIARARLAIREAARYFLYDPNISLIDFGHPLHGGYMAEDEIAIRFHVHEKLSQVELQAASDAGLTRPIPPVINGFQTDVPQRTYHLHLWGTAPSLSSYSGTCNPLRGGVSISDIFHNAYGTLGGLVTDRNTGAQMLLSNWHVLVNNWTARPGVLILQPGRLDGGTGQNMIASLSRHAMFSNLDAAVAVLNSSRQIVNNQVGLGPVNGVGQAQLDMQLVKSGRGSGITTGRITAVEGIARLTYVSLQRVIRNVMTIEPISPIDPVSAPGDSGSWWLDANTHQAVGLHFAGSNQPETALAIDMQQILNALNVDILTAGRRPVIQAASVQMQLVPA